MRLSIIVAMARNGVIGRENRLPWHLSADLRRFKSLTMGHHLIMGRLTFESIGRPLPGRTMIVLTRASEQLEASQGVLLAASLEAAIEMATDDDEVFVAGGAEVYREALPRADRLYLTRVHADIEGDRCFPFYSHADWRLVAREDHPACEPDGHAYSFLVLDRLRETSDHDHSTEGDAVRPGEASEPSGGFDSERRACNRADDRAETRCRTAMPGASGGAAPR